MLLFLSHFSERCLSFKKRVGEREATKSLSAAEEREKFPKD
jgi:hypothetical protein